MSSLRTFIALDIPAHTQTQITKQTATLQRLSGVRWIPTGNLHLTLKFLGDVTPAKIDTVAQSLSDLAARVQVFEIHITGLGTFPNIRNPRIIWIGIQAPQTLQTLHRGLETATTKLGFPPEKRSFNPHLTIGRVKRHISPEEVKNLQAALSNTDIGQIETISVNALHIYKSDLKPTGAVYTKLYSTPLSNP
ncbi:MAG: RNA 2',3'-cyclic phosphodiesterase [Anaerolineales bacterium]